MSVYTLATFILILYSKGSLSVYIRSVEVPKEARAEEDVSLWCLVDPWPGPLYSLSWWKDGSQFYRASVAYSIGNLATVFALPGIKVKAGLGGLGHVVLQRVGVAATGTYVCEAVADFPTFSQHLVTANMTIIDPPATRPILVGYKIRYYPGEVLGVNCTVLRAHPTPVFTWFINGLQVEDGVQEVLEVTQEADLTRTTTARLTLRLKRHHFTNNEVNLTCGARVGHNLWITNSITTQRARPRQYHHHLKKVKGGAGGHTPTNPQQSLQVGGSARGTPGTVIWKALMFAAAVDLLTSPLGA
ncbi:uncharacterized protein LOC121863005 [Homarus americanus]|nr:uncharacterized protein LOC121863005 [Homarus americanus]